MFLIEIFQRGIFFLQLRSEIRTFCNWNYVNIYKTQSFILRENLQSPPFFIKTYLLPEVHTPGNIVFCEMKHFFQFQISACLIRFRHQGTNMVSCSVRSVCTETNPKRIRRETQNLYYVRLISALFLANTQENPFHTKSDAYLPSFLAHS